MSMKENRMTSDTLLYPSPQESRQRHHYRLVDEDFGRDSVLSEGRESLLAHDDLPRHRSNSAASSYSGQNRFRLDPGRTRPDSAKSYRDRIMYRRAGFNSRPGSGSMRRQASQHNDIPVHHNLMEHDRMTSQLDRMTSQHDRMTSQHDRMTSQQDTVTSQHNTVTSQQITRQPYDLTLDYLTFQRSGINQRTLSDNQLGLGHLNVRNPRDDVSLLQDDDDELDYVYRPDSEFDDVIDIDDDESIAAFCPTKSYGGSALTDMSSMFSMNEDDFDRNITQQIKKLFDNMDGVLYDGDKTKSSQLKNECDEWTSNFPHLRLVGSQLCPSSDVGYEVLTRDERQDHHHHQVFTSSTRSLHQPVLSVSGERIGSERHTGIISPTIPDVFDSDREGSICSAQQQEVPAEEIYEQNGSMEEVFAIDYQHDVDDDGRRTAAYRSSRGLPPVTPFTSVRHNVIDIISDSLFKKIILSSSPVWKRFARDINPDINEDTRHIDLADPRLRSISRVAEAAAMQSLRLETLEDLELLDQEKKGIVKRRTSVPSGVRQTIPRKLPTNVTSKKIQVKPKSNDIGIGQSDSQSGVQNSHMYQNFPAYFERYKTSLNRLKQGHPEVFATSPQMENTKSLNVEGFRVNGQSMEQSEPKSRTPRILPPIPQRKISDPINITNTNINRSLEPGRRLSIRSNSTLYERVTSRMTPLRENDRISSMTAIPSSFEPLHRPSTMQSFRGDLSLSRKTTSLSLPHNSIRRASVVSSYKNMGPFRSLDVGGSLNPAVRRYRGSSRVNTPVR